MRLHFTKVTLLFARLALFAHRPHSRKDMIQAVWPDVHPDEGRQRLRQAICSLKQRLSDLPPPHTSDSLFSDREYLSLHTDLISTDVGEFEALLQSSKSSEETQKIQSLSKAISLYKGPLLQGFDEEWVNLERERLEQICMSAILELIDLYRKQNNLTEALKYAFRAVELDPLYETAQFALIRLLADSGNSKSARRQYRRYSRRLRENMQLSPSQDLRKFVSSLPL